MAVVQVICLFLPLVLLLGASQLVLMSPVRDELIFEKMMVRNVCLGFRPVVAMARLRHHSLTVLAPFLLPDSPSHYPAYNLNDYYLYSLPVDSMTSDGDVYLHDVSRLAEAWTAISAKMSTPFDGLLAISDSLYDYLLVTYPGVTYAYNIDTNTVLDLYLTPSLVTIHDSSSLAVPLLSSSTPLTFYVLSQVPRSSTITASPSPESISRYRLTRWTLVGSTANLSAVTGATSSGETYRICQAADGEHIITRYGAECTNNVDWNIGGGFVDEVYVHLWDRFKGWVYRFPVKALTPEGSGVPVKVEKKLKRHVFYYGKPPMSAGAIVAIVFGTLLGLMILCQKVLALGFILYKRRAPPVVVPQQPPPPIIEKELDLKPNPKIKQIKAASEKSRSRKTKKTKQRPGASGKSSNSKWKSKSSKARRDGASSSSRYSSSKSKSKSKSKSRQSGSKTTPKKGPMKAATTAESVVESSNEANFCKYY